MITHIGDCETERFVLEVYECNCGFHIGLDATYMDQVCGLTLICPCCSKEHKISGFE